jgi:hypothetical protein
MKTLKVAVLIALTCAVAQAQSRSIADATYALKGPVRTFKTEVATFTPSESGYVEGPRVIQMEATFNEDGNRTDLRIYNDKGVHTRRIAMTFEGRNNKESINYDGAGKMYLRTVHSLDEKGLPNGSMTYDGNGSLRSKWIIKRNDRGLATQSTEYDSKGVLMTQIDVRYDGPMMLSHERKCYYPTGSLRLLATYAAATKRSETTTFAIDGSILNKSFRDHWDVAEYAADGSLQKVTAIDSDHRLVDEVTVTKDGPKKREAELPDELDSFGNWIKKTQWITDAKGTRPVKVTYRTLTYY